jgi:DNA-binding MarR family transcriptional regulator
MSIRSRGRSFMVDVVVSAERSRTGERVRVRQTAKTREAAEKLEEELHQRLFAPWAAPPAKTAQASPRSIAAALGLYRVVEELFAIDSTMPVSQALILMFVASEGGARGLSVTDIAVALDMDLARVSRNLKLLVDQGLVEQQRDPAAFRVKLNRLSPEGDKFVERLSAYV